MSFINPGKYTHVSRGYAVTEAWDRKTCKDTGKYCVVDNDTYGCPWERSPVFEHRHKQVCIEFCNYANSIGGTKAKYPEEFETKHYIFKRKGKYSCYWIVEEKCVVPNPYAMAEVIHRKNRRIKELKGDLISAQFDAVKYKRMLIDLYNQLHAKREYEVLNEIEQSIYGKEGIPEDVRKELWKEVRK